MRYFILCLALILAGKLDAQKLHSPNIIFILTDDHGWAHTSHAADPKVPNSSSDYYETPNMDSLAARGILFTQGYAPNPICAPTRNSVMFGQNAARHIYSEDTAWHTRTDHWLTIPRVLKLSDPQYKAAHFGKWHIAMEPSVAGFDQSDGMPTNGGGEVFADGYINHSDFNSGVDSFLISNAVPNPLRIKKAGKPTLYWSDENPKDIYGITNRAKEFMDNCVQDGHPFYVQLSHFATHLSLSSKKETFDYFKDKAKGDRHKSPEYAAMLKDLDDAIGMILQYVQDAGLSDNTYIFLMGDNGGRLTFNQMASLDENKKLVEVHYDEEGDRNLPLRDGKHSFYEGGLRVPFIVLGPGVQSGRVVETPVTGLDLLPTFADLAGYDDDLPKEIDGGSLKPILLNVKEKNVKRSESGLFFHQASHRPPRSAVRLGDYKLVKYWEKDGKYPGTPKAELFDLSKDLKEKFNIARAYPAKARKLENLLDRFVKQTGTITTRRDVESAVYRLLDELELDGDAEE